MVIIVTTRHLRTLRAAVFATLCVALAATAHIGMSDAELPVYVVLAAFSGTAGVTWLLADRRRGLAVVSGWMVAVQAALHLFFEVAAPMRMAAAPVSRSARDWASLLLCAPGHSSVGTPPDELARAAGLNPHVLSVSVADSMPDMPGMPGMSGMPGMADVAQASGMTQAGSMPSVQGMSPGMLVAHLVAALACALFLWRGEAAVAGVFQLLRALAGAVLPLLLLAVPCGFDPAQRCRPSTRRHSRLPRLVLLSHAVVRRGPPLTFAV